MKYFRHFFVLIMLLSASSYAEENKNPEIFVDGFTKTILKECDKYLTTCNGHRLLIVENYESLRSNDPDKDMGVWIRKLLRSKGIEIDAFFDKKTRMPIIISDITHYE